MSCNTFIPIMDLVREVEALLAANYIDKDDPRITGGVFTNPTIKEGFLLDVQAREEFCRLVQECGLDAPFGKMWLSRPLYPDSMFVSYEDSGEPQTKWKTIQAVLESAGVFGPAATSLSSRLAAEIDRATTVENGIISQAAAADANIAANATAISTESSRAAAAEGVLTSAVDALELKDLYLQSQVNSIGGGKKAYVTYELMVADKDNIDPNSSIDVSNDPDPLKNGTYSYDGAVFTKSIYDVESIVRTKVLNTFKTKALMDASALPDGADAQVNNDTANNGQYVKTAGTWVKAAYDPLAQAKEYADTNKLDFDDINYTYSSGNMTKRSELKIIEGYGINSSDLIVKSSSFDISSIAVFEGDVLYLHNSKESYAAAGGGIYKFLSEKLNIEDLSANTIVPDNRTTFVGVDGKNYRKVTVPVGASTLAFNTKFNDVIEWAITKNEALPYTADAGAKNVVGLHGVTVSDPDFLTYLDGINSSVSNYGDIYNIKDTKLGYLNSAGAVTGDGGTIDWRYFTTPINEGSRYYMRVTRASTGYPFVVFYSKSETTMELPFETAMLSRAELKATTKENIYYFDVPEGAGIVSLFMNVKVDTGAYANPPQKLDITESLSIQEGEFKEEVVGVPILNLPSLNGYNLIDAAARRELAKISSGEDTSIDSRFKSKRVMAIGDSITQGTMGGYVKYIESAMGTEITNIAMSGSSASRMVDKLLAGSGLPKRDAPTAGSTWDVLDKTGISCAFVMLGTNDVGGAPVQGVDILPSEVPSDYPDINDYWQLFPNTYMGNMALIIEIIKHYSPESEIFIISPPHKYYTSGSQSISTKINPMLQVLCKHYSLSLIDGTHESGLSYKLFNGDLDIYSYDGIHLNERGNKLFGEFIARKIL